MEPRSFNGNIKDLIRVLRLPILAALLILGACSTPKPPPAVSAELTATPELTEAGIWRLTWETKNAREVTLNGDAVPANGNHPVTSGDLGEYVLKAGKEERKLTLGAIVVTIEAVDDASGDLLVGDEITLRATVTSPDSSEGVAPSTEVEWSTSDSSIATIDADGLVKAVNPGSVIIWAQSVQDSAARKKFDIDVSTDAETPDVSVEITRLPDPDSLLVGDEFTFEATVSPGTAEQEITWSAEPADRISIDRNTGESLILAPGEITVTARTIYKDVADTRSFEVPEPEILKSLAAVQPDDAPEHCSEPADDTVWYITWEVAKARTVFVNDNPVDASGCTAASFVENQRATAQAWTLDVPGHEPQTIRVGALHVKITEPESVSPLYVREGAEITAVATVSAAPGHDSQFTFADTYTWSSSKPDIVDIDSDGKITAKNPGPATITAQSTQDASASATIDVQVLDPAIESFDYEFGDQWAGGEITLTWTARDISDVVLYEIDTDFDPAENAEGSLVDPDRILEPNGTPLDGSLTIRLPSSMPAVRYRLEGIVHAGPRVEAHLDEPLELPGWVCADNERIVTFEDPTVDNAVRSLYSNDHHDLTDPLVPVTCIDVQRELDSEEDDSVSGPPLETVSVLNFNRCDDTVDPLTSLAGLQHLTKLRRLELMCNELDSDDIRHVASLTGLQEINLDRNNVSDLNHLKSLENLQVLGLYDNEVKDLGPLADLTELQVAYLSENHIKDISPLENHPALRHLWLYLNCENIDWVLDVDGNPDYPAAWDDCYAGDGLEVLDTIENLESLVLGMNQIGVLDEALGSLEHLRFLHLSANQLRSIAPVENLSSLRALRLDGNYITDLEPLRNNDDFPAVANPEEIPWQFSRNGVLMPGSSSTPEVHLTLHENCLSDDPDNPPYIYVTSLTDADYDVRGLNEQRDPSECVAGRSAFQTFSTPRYSDEYLRELNNFRHYR